MISIVLNICLWLWCAAASEWNSASSFTFRQALDVNESCLVSFIEPSIEACKSFQPEWSAVLKQAQVPLLAIDCAKEAELCREQDIISYPTIRLFKRGGGFVRYRGQRKASSVVAFVKRSKLPNISVLDLKNITSFQNVDEIVFIAFLAPQDSSTRPKIAAVATRYSDRFVFGVTTDLEAAKMLKAPIPSVVGYNSHGNINILPLPATTRELEDFIEECATPIVVEMTRRNELKHMKSGKSLVYILSTSESERSQFQQSLKTLAKKYHEYLNFVTIDAVEYASMAQALGVEVGELASLAVLNPKLGQVFIYPENQRRSISADDVEGFVMDIVQGKAKPMGDEAPGNQARHQEL